MVVDGWKADQPYHSVMKDVTKVNEDPAIGPSVAKPSMFQVEPV